MFPSSPDHLLQRLFLWVFEDFFWCLTLAPKICHRKRQTNHRTSLHSALPIFDCDFATDSFHTSHNTAPCLTLALRPRSAGMTPPWTRTMAPVMRATSPMTFFPKSTKASSSTMNPTWRRDRRPTLSSTRILPRDLKPAEGRSPTARPTRNLKKAAGQKSGQEERMMTTWMRMTLSRMVTVDRARRAQVNRAADQARRRPPGKKRFQRRISHQRRGGVGHSSVPWMPLSNPLPNGDARRMISYVCFLLTW